MGGQQLKLGVVCGLLAVVCGTVSANDDFPKGRDPGVQKVQKAFEITVRDRGNPVDPVLASPAC